MLVLKLWIDVLAVQTGEDIMAALEFKPALDRKKQHLSSHLLFPWGRTSHVLEQVGVPCLNKNSI